MIYLLLFFVLLFCAALVYVVFDLTRQRNFWRERHDTLRLELDQMNHANADANMQRAHGFPVFRQPPEPQKAAKAFELGHDRAERERQQKLLEPDTMYVTDDLSDADLKHLDKIGESVS